MIIEQVVVSKDESCANNVLKIFSVKSQIVKKLGIQTNYSPLVPSREHLTSYEPKTVKDLPPR